MATLTTRVRLFGSLLLLGALAALLGCNGKQKQDTTEELLKKLNAGKCERVPIEIFLQAKAKLNPNAKGQPMPVEVRIFLLKERETFEGLDFETIWQRGEEALAKDLVKTASLTVFPGKLKIYPMKSKADVAYIALVAIFRKPQGTDWYHIYDVREQNKRCAGKEALHTIIHAVLDKYRVAEPSESSK